MFLCHNVIPHEKGGPVKALTKSAFSKGDVFIVHSDEDASNLKGLIPTAKIKKARHPTYEVFSQQSVDCQQSRETLGIPLDSNIVLFFGLVREYKGLKYLIDAMPKVIESLDAMLVIAGEFYDDRKKYIEQIKELGIDDRIYLHDKYVPNEEVATYFSAADLLVLPYISATQSGIVQIAYGFNRPVITTDVGGLPEAVTHDKTGFVVPPEDSKALADAIIRFFQENKAEQFSSNIRALKDEFSWDRMVETIEDLTSNREVANC
jgi:glycosyltransferase involved in cell wall biosynthesis